MASWAEIERVRKDPTEFRQLALRLNADDSFDRSETADEFLEKISTYHRDELTKRQAEFLLDLRNDAEKIFDLRGLSVATLIEKVFQARLELNDDADIERIEKLKATGQRFVTGRQMGWFRRICKELNEIEEYV